MTEEITRALARFETTLAHVAQSAEEVKTKVDNIHDKVLIHGESLKSAHKRIDSVEEAANDYKATKNKGLGLMSGIALVAGGVGSMVAKLFSGG